VETHSIVVLKGEQAIFAGELYHSDGCNSREEVKSRNTHTQICSDWLQFSMHTTSTVREAQNISDLVTWHTYKLLGDILEPL
jgi:hypothetical protein